MSRSAFNKENVKSGRSAVQLKYVEETTQTIEDKSWGRFRRMCEDVDIRDNFYLSWFARGRRGFNPEANPDFAPPCLREDNFLALKVSPHLIRTIYIECPVQLLFNVSVCLSICLESDWPGCGVHWLFGVIPQSDRHTHHR